MKLYQENPHNLSAQPGADYYLVELAPTPTWNEYGERVRPRSMTLPAVSIDPPPGYVALAIGGAA